MTPKGTKSLAARKKSTRRERTMPASVTLRALGPSQWFVVALLDRGPNVQTVNSIEIGAGGDPGESVPYEVAAYPIRAAADNLANKFTAASATTEVRSA